MEDVIERSGYAFGTNEAIILSQLSLAAIPTAMIIFLELITIEEPPVCIVDEFGECATYYGIPNDVCGMNNTVEWEYIYPEGTVISSYDLLCASVILRRLPPLLFYLGMVISCLLIGQLSDYLGRKVALLSFLLLEGVFVASLIAVNNFAGYCVIRFMTGLCVGYFVVCEILIVEGLKVEYRHTFLAAIWSSFAAGIMLLGALNFCFDRYLDILACLVIIIFLLWAIYLFGIQESLRWLLVKRKRDEAVYILHKIAYLNGVELPSYDDIPKPADDQYRLRDLFVLPKSRWTILILLQVSIVSLYMLDDYTQTTIDSFINSERYKTIGFTDQEAARSVDLVLSGVVFLLGVIIASLSCCFLGRKPATTLEVLVLLAGLIMLLCSSDEILVETSSYMIRISTPGLIYVTSLYSLEAFITPLRSRAVGLVVSGAAFGGVLSAIKSFYKETGYLNSVILIVEIVSVSYLVIITLCLEETKGRALPDSEEDMIGVKGIRDMCNVSGEEGKPLLTSQHGSHGNSGASRGGNNNKLSESDEISMTDE